MFEVMDLMTSGPPHLTERMANFWQRGVRFVARLAIAFGLAVLSAIIVGAAVTDNALAQIVVTILAAFGFWLPFLFLVARVDRFLERRRNRPLRASRSSAGGNEADEGWGRLIALAPAYSERLLAMRNSLERSRLTLGKAELDPGAHDLCLLIDRRLPELIHRELDTLPPDDRNRERQVGELVDLIEQFARHCSRSRDNLGEAASYEAAVLRRRFEAHLSDPWERQQ